jgi:hypothetical protein
MRDDEVIWDATPQIPESDIVWDDTPQVPASEVVWDDTPQPPPEARSSIIVDVPESQPNLTSTASREGSLGEAVPLTDSELDVIAKRHGTTAKALRPHAIARGATLSTTIGIGQELAGVAATTIGSGLLMNIPQKLYALTEDKPTQEAIDELQATINKKRSWAEVAGEVGAGVLLPGTGLAKAATVAKTLKGAMAAGAAEGALMGAAAGFGASDADKEVSGTIAGAVGGAALGGALTAAGRGLSKLLGKSALADELTAAASHVDDESLPPVDIMSHIDAADAQAVERSAMATRLKPEGVDIVEEAQKKLAEPATSEYHGVTFELIQHLAAQDMSATGKKLDKGAVGRMVTDLLEDSRMGDGADILLHWAGPAPTAAESMKRVQSDFSGILKEFASFVRGGGKVGNSERALQIVRDSEPALLEKEWGDFLLTRTISEGAEKRNAAMLSKTGATQHMHPVTWLRAARYVASEIDRRIPGLNATDLIDKFSMANKKHTIILHEWMTEAKQLGDRYVRLPDAEKKALYHALDTADEAQVGALGEESSKLYNDYRTLFEKQRVDANERAGYELIKKNEAYVPHMAKQQTDGVVIIDKYLKQFRDKGLNLLSEETTTDDVLKYLKKNKGERELMQQVLRSIDFYYGQPKELLGKIGQKLDMEQLRKSYANISHVDYGTRSREDIIARAALRREGDIPMLIRDTELPALQQRWANNTSRAVHLEPVLSELRTARNIAAGVKDMNAAEYLTNLLQDISGRNRKTTANHISAWMENSRMQILRSAVEMPEGPMRKATEVLAEWPRIFNGALQQLYPNFLGLHNWKSAVVNSMQPFTSMVPEMGQIYGTTKAMKAYARVARMMKEGKLVDTLKAEGFRGAEFSTDLQSVIHDTLLANPILRKSRDALNKANSLTMTLFSAAENINIAVAVETGRDVARDLFKAAQGQLGAMESGHVQAFVSRMQEGPRRILLRALEKGDIAAAQELLARYMVGKTVLNYDRANMASAARYVGPLFSMFTRWPTAVIGDIIEQYGMSKLQHGGVIKGLQHGGLEAARKLIMPVLIIGSLEAAVSDEYQGNFARAFPIQSLGTAAQGRMASPPILQPLGALAPAIMGDWEKAGNALIKATEGFVPFAVPVHKALKWANE